MTKQGLQVNRRYFFGRASTGIGAVALGSLLEKDLYGKQRNVPTLGPHYRPKVSRVIYLFQSGGPSQLDLYDYKPKLAARFGQEVPKSIYPDERKTTMTSAQTSFATTPTRFTFLQNRHTGVRMSELLPNLSSISHKICLIRSMYTDAINHDPAITFFQTGSQIPGRPSIGSWLNYGLGTENSDLPAFVAMSSKGTGRAGQPLYDRLWGSGFLPSKYQGVKFRNQGNPVLDIYNPQGVSRNVRRRMLDGLARLNRLKYQQVGDPEIEARIAQYELAYRMQTSIPELLDFSDEPDHVLGLYGPDVQRQGSYAYNCLIARRLAESGVRFIQLFHQGWDQHRSLPKQIREQCKDTDQPSAGLIRDLEQRGMLDDTLIIWGGEFGRTVYSQGKLKNNKNYGRDHHGHCFSMWIAGGGVRGGLAYGETDDYSVNVAHNGVHIHDMQATILHLLGIDHERLTYEYQGRDFRLTDVHGQVKHDILA